jgi:hypothetical protein
MLALVCVTLVVGIGLAVTAPGMSPNASRFAANATVVKLGKPVTAAAGEPLTIR